VDDGIGLEQYVRRVLEAYRKTPGTMGTVRRADRMLAVYYRAALLVKYTMAGVALGWTFWRWGLPYSILCHAAVNAVHLALEDRFF